MAQTITVKMMYEDSGYYFIDADEADQGAAGSGLSVKDLIDAIGVTKNATLVFAHSGGGNTTTYSFGTSETIPQNIEVVVENGAILAIATGVTLTIDGSFQNGRNSCITLAGTGTVIFDKRFVNYLYPEWWGAIGDDSTACNTAIQAAINCAEAMGGCIVDFAAATYRFTTLTMDDPGVLLQGKGIDATVLKTTAATGNLFTIGDTGSTYNASGGIRDLSIYTTVARTAHFVIYIDGCEQGIINNVKIGEHGGYDMGGGIYFGATLSTLWTVSDSVLEIPGPFYAIYLVGGNDQFLDNLWIRGDSTNDTGAVGIYLLNNGGAWFKDIDIVSFYYGIQIQPGDGNTVSWINMSNVLCDSCVKYGFLIDCGHAGGVTKGLSFISCWAGTNGAALAAARGIYINETAGSVDGIYFVNPRVVDNGGHGIEVTSGPTNVSITGGMVTGNSQQSSGTYNGIYMNTADHWVINGVSSGDIGGAGATQKYGIEIVSGCTNFICVNNKCYGNGTNGILDSSGAVTKEISANLPAAV